MLTPSIFGENLFDEFFDDFFDFPVFDDREMKKAQKKLYGRHAANMMKTDVKEQISVEDIVPGIPEEMKPHIFEMFYTGKTTVADSHRSLGLGLALCHSIIEAHNGTLILTDHAPHGCNFIFTLPLSEVTLNE